MVFNEMPYMDGLHMDALTLEQIPKVDLEKHQRTLQAMAAELAVPVDELAGLYESVLGRMWDGAAVRDFLPVFVAREVRRRLDLAH